MRSPANVTVAVTIVEVGPTLTWKRWALLVLLVSGLAVIATGVASSAPERIATCSVYLLGGGETVTFTNPVYAKLPGGAHGTPPFDCAYGAHDLTAHKISSTTRGHVWTTVPQHQTYRLQVNCVLYERWLGAPLRIVDRGGGIASETCTYLSLHGP